MWHNNTTDCESYHNRRDHGTIIGITANFHRIICFVIQRTWPTNALAVQAGIFSMFILFLMKSIDLQKYAHSLNLARNNKTGYTNPAMHQSHITQRTILLQKFAHMCTFLLQNGALWNTCLKDCRICEMGLFWQLKVKIGRSVNIQSHFNIYINFLV